MTEKQKFKKIRARHLTSFRRFITLQSTGEGIVEYIGLNAWELREIIQNNWQPEMNWENYGKLWVVDHVVAMKYFDPTNIKDLKICWHPENLQPSYFTDNHAKGYCVEVTKRSIERLPDSAMKTVLMNRINSYVDMFDIYYQKAS